MTWSALWHIAQSTLSFLLLWASKKALDALWPVVRSNWRAILSILSGIAAVTLFALAPLFFSTVRTATQADIGHALMLLALAWIFGAFAFMGLLSRITGILNTHTESLRLVTDVLGHRQL